MGVNLNLKQVKEWIKERMNTEIQIEAVKGTLDTFIVEPFIAHAAEDEYYVCIQSTRRGEEILFYHEGGVDVGDVDEKASRLAFEVDEEVSDDTN